MIESTAAASSAGGASVGGTSTAAASSAATGTNSTIGDADVRLPAYIAAQKNSTALAVHEKKPEPISSKKFIQNEIDSFKNTIFLAFEKKWKDLYLSIKK